MARGHQKEKSQLRNQKNKAAQKKKTDGKAAAGAGLQLQCTICLAQFSYPKKPVMLQEHINSKHSKSTLKDCFSDLRSADLRRKRHTTSSVSYTHLTLPTIA
eukprot:TRINITY_DN4227_c0_g1_i2.p1 TRINITY_DN4227_c0_g1~~TRINITY_DN4227_c0_g1_i2.p1  ORF type:complete len:115 (-),score=29.86 TRINITY_DN4227_c0_g1_i2:23-328(-)